ncbi:hypothetical protein Barb6_00636 [Bacteroidales bacterium Barb6]|nr:hypothetical protein Barb6_00636 [Bacteroidales bacterium Barb6]
MNNGTKIMIFLIVGLLILDTIPEGASAQYQLLKEKPPVGLRLTATGNDL